jgi:hypothetical protein
VDVFRVTGGTTHDYVLHGAIRWDQTWQCSFPLVTNPVPYPMLEGSEVWSEPTSSGDSFPYYGFWRNVSSNQAPGNFQITYRDTSSSHRDLRLWMTDDGSAKVYLGMTPNPGRDNTVPANFYVYWRPSAIIRKRITSGTLQDLFVSVIEPMNGGASTIQSVDRLPVNGSNLESAALRITFTDGRVDTYIVNLRNPQVAGATGGSATVSTADEEYSLTGRVGVHMDRMSGDSRVWTVNATDFQYPGRRLTTPNTVYSGLIAGETRKLTGGANDAFTTTTPLPGGTALRNKYVSLTHGALSGSGTTGISEMFKVDQVILTNGQYYLCFTNDHMLEIMNGTTSVEQMAPLRTFTGSNSFEIALTAFAGQVSPLADVIIPPGSSSGPISFNFGNLGSTAGASLQVSAISANQALVPDGNLSLGGSGTNRTITVTPVNGGTGSSLITVSVTDGLWTNSRSFNAVVSVLALAASPASQSVLPGGSTAYTATVTSTNGFAGMVTFGMVGLPAGIGASFNPPSITGAGSSTVNVTASNSVSPGSYTLTLTASSGSLAATSTVALVVQSIVALPGTMLWTGSNNWSTLANWTNLTAGGYGPPGISDDVVFGNSGTVAGSNTVNSTVDSDLTVDSLIFTNTSGFHTILINPGRTLSVVGTAAGFQNSPALNVGLEDYTMSPNQLVRAGITGSAGTLAINNALANIQIRMGYSNSVVGPLAALDLSGLGTFNANINRIQLGAESGTPRQVAGILYLARTNKITMVQPDNVNGNFTSGSPALYLGHNTHSGNSNGSALYLGITNALFVNFIVNGRGNQTNNVIAFNPAFLSNQPSVFIRASDGVGRVGIWTTGDNSPGTLPGPSSGTNDFTGGTVDALVDLLFLGRGRVGTNVNTGIGTLTFEAGTIDANTLRLGTMIDDASSTNASGVGTANVNGTSTLVVNTVLELAHTNTIARPTAAAIAGTRGTLNINGGTVQAPNIVGAGGTGTINLNRGTLDLQDANAVPGSMANVTTLNIGAAAQSDAALLVNAASISVVNPITIASNGIVAGNTVITAPKLTINGKISPGPSDVGTLVSSGPVTFGAGGRYAWDISDALGSPGAAWDLLQSSGGFDVQATAANPFVIQLRSIENQLQGLPDFDNNNAYSWTIASGNGGVTNFAASKFAVDNIGFVDDLAGGYFFVSASGGSLNVVFTNNHPPVASDAIYYYTPGTTLKIPIAALASQWTDPDTDSVAFANVNSSSANGFNNVSSDANYIYYTDSGTQPDTITYTIADVRTNPPAAYRFGDTQRTGVGLIQILPMPTITVTISGPDLILIASNGQPGATVYVLASTNVALPVASWNRIQTNVFDGNGTFTFTAPVDAGVTQQFYRLQLP